MRELLRPALPTRGLELSGPWLTLQRPRAAGKDLLSVEHRDRDGSFRLILEGAISTWRPSADSAHGVRFVDAGRVK